MIILDEKDGLMFGNFCLINKELQRDKDINFKVSSVYPQSIVSEKGILSNHDLTIIGDITADNINIKGSFNCKGNCNAKKIMVNGEFICEGDLECDELIIREKAVIKNIVFAKRIEIMSDCIVQQSLNLEGELTIDSYLLLGEGLFGSGSIKAKKILYGDFNDFIGQIDGDIVEDVTIRSKTNPTVKQHSSAFSLSNLAEEIDAGQQLLFEQLVEIGVNNDDWVKLGKDLEEVSYISKDIEIQNEFYKKMNKLRGLKTIYANDYLDAIEIENEAESYISANKYNKKQLTLIKFAFENSLKAGSNREDILQMKLNSYLEFMHYQCILTTYGQQIPDDAFELIAESLYSSIGIKPVFIRKILESKGWNIK